VISQSRPLYDLISCHKMRLVWVRLYSRGTHSLGILPMMSVPTHCFSWLQSCCCCCCCFTTARSIFSRSSNILVHCWLTGVRIVQTWSNSELCFYSYKGRGWATQQLPSLQALRTLTSRIDQDQPHPLNSAIIQQKLPKYGSTRTPCGFFCQGY